MKLTVNATKTHSAHSDDGVKFLGIHPDTGKEGGQTQAEVQNTDKV